MLLTKKTLATMEAAAEQVWDLKEKAEQKAKETAEAKLVEALKEKWLKMKSKINAAQLLLEDEAEVIEMLDRASGLQGGLE